MDLGHLLDPIDGDSPSGIEARNDARFHAIERLLEPASRANKVKADGTLNESAQDADWQQVLDQSTALAGESRDLRLLVILTRSLARTDGYEGLVSGLGLIADTLRGHWGDLHPNLRDRDDPRMAALPRTNALKQLENDENGLLGDLKYGTALSMRGLGTVAGMDLAGAALSDFDYMNRTASGLNEAEKAALLDKHQKRVNRVTAVARATAAEQPEVAATLIAGLTAAEAAVQALCVAYAEAGAFGDPVLHLPELVEFLQNCKSVMEAVVAETGGAAALLDEAADPAAASPSAANGTASPDGASRAAAPTQPVASGPGSITSRKDVERSLDMIIDFYERTEPSSPIPHLARRMRRMVPMDFVQLMEEIAPSGMKEFSTVAGVELQKKK